MPVFVDPHCSLLFRERQQQLLVHERADRAAERTVQQFWWVSLARLSWIHATSTTGNYHRAARAMRVGRRPLGDAKCCCGPDIIQFCGPDTPIAANFSNLGPNQCIFKSTVAMEAIAMTCADSLAPPFRNMPGRVDSTGSQICEAAILGEMPRAATRALVSMRSPVLVTSRRFPFRAMTSTMPRGSQTMIPTSPSRMLSTIVRSGVWRIPPRTELEYLLRGCKLRAASRQLRRQMRLETPSFLCDCVLGVAICQ